MWDGAQPTLEAQAEQVLRNPAVMNTSWPELLAKLRGDPECAASFRTVYHEAPTPANILDALATYERSLITPNARFDRYLRGEQQPLSAREGGRPTLRGKRHDKLGMASDVSCRRPPPPAHLPAAPESKP